MLNRDAGDGEAKTVWPIKNRGFLQWRLSTRTLTTAPRGHRCRKNLCQPEVKKPSFRK